MTTCTIFATHGNFFKQPHEHLLIIIKLSKLASLHGVRGAKYSKHTIIALNASNDNAFKDMRIAEYVLLMLESFQKVKIR